MPKKKGKKSKKLAEMDDNAVGDSKRKVRIVGVSRSQTDCRHINPNLMLAMQNENDPTKKLYMLRDMPGLSLKIRRKLREQMQLANVKLYSKLKDWKHRQIRSIGHFFARLRELFYWLYLWRKSIKRIEGQYGAAVGAYFIFLRWLFFLNTILCLFAFLFLIMPQFIFQTSDSHLEELNMTSDTTREQVLECSQLYQKGNVSTMHVSRYFSDFLQGTGWMERSIYFYGYYPSRRLSLSFFGLSYYYNVPLVYLSVTFVYLLVSMILMVHHTGKSMKAQALGIEAGAYKQTNTVLCAWDFGVNEAKAVQLKHRGIFNQLLSDIFEQNNQLRRANRNIYERVILYSTRLFINICVVLVLCCAFFLIYTTTQECTKLLEKQESVFSSRSRVEHSDTMLGRTMRLFYEFLPSLVMTSLSFIIPRVFARIVTGEDYSTELAMRVTLSRTVFLKLASPAILLGTLYLQVSCKPADSCLVGISPECRSIRCWETYVGQQLYKIIILDFITIVFVIVFIDFPRRVVVTKIPCFLTRMVGKAEFNTNKSVLNLVYGQALCWVGMFFSPMLIFTCTAKLFMIFYFRKTTCMCNFNPPERPFKASKLHTFFVLLLMAAFIVCCVPIIFMIWTMPPSRSCGPFRYFHSMMDVYTNMMVDWPGYVKFAVRFITSPGFLVPGFLVIVMVLYYYQTTTNVYKKRCENLEDELIMEGADHNVLKAEESREEI